jgi:hypothetical protein
MEQNKQILCTSGRLKHYGRGSGLIGISLFQTGIDSFMLKYRYEFLNKQIINKSAKMSHMSRRTHLTYRKVLSP